MRTTRRMRQTYMPASDWFYPESLQAVNGLVKCAFYEREKQGRAGVGKRQPETPNGEPEATREQEP